MTGAASESGQIEIVGTVFIIIPYDVRPLKSASRHKGRAKYNIIIRKEIKAMITKKNNDATANEINEKYTVKVTRAREIKKAEKEQVISFDLVVNDVTIYGMIYRSGVSQKGKDYELVSFPARKGSDDTYYNHVWFPITRELQAVIVDQISEKLSA